MRAPWRPLIGCCVALLLGGCASDASVGWSSRTPSAGAGNSLGAGDPLGQAMFAARQRSEDRAADVERMFGLGISEADLRDQTTAVTSVDTE